MTRFTWALKPAKLMSPASLGTATSWQFIMPGDRPNPREPPAMIAGEAVSRAQQLPLPHG